MPDGVIVVAIVVLAAMGAGTFWLSWAAGRTRALDRLVGAVTLGRSRAE